MKKYIRLKGLTEEKIDEVKDALSKIGVLFDVFDNSLEAFYEEEADMRLSMWEEYNTNVVLNDELRNEILGNLQIEYSNNDYVINGELLSDLTDTETYRTIDEYNERGVSVDVAHGEIKEPSKEAFIDKLLCQFTDVVNLVFELGSVENLISRYNSLPYEIEINGDNPSIYEGEEIEIIRIETDNLLVYLDSNFEIIDEITIYDDYGNQLGDFRLKAINIENSDLTKLL